MADPTDFEVSESRLAEGTVELRIAGELDRAVAAAVEDAIDRADGAETVLVNLSACEFMDSAGVTLLLRARRRLEESGGRLLLAGQDGQVGRLLGMTGVA